MADEPDKSKHTQSQKTRIKRPRADWEAVHRDYRTGKWTLRELSAKHNVSDAEISRHSKKHGWTKDLREVIKQATDAAVLSELVTGSQNSVTETILIAAEVNKQVILTHRGDLRDLRASAASLLHELTVASLLAEDQEILAQVLAGSGAEPVDEARARAAVQKALNIGNRISSIKALADTFDKLHTGERRAFGIAEVEEETPARAQKRVLLEFIDAKEK